MKYFVTLLLALLLCSCSHNEDENGPILPGDDEDKVFNEPAKDLSNALTGSYTSTGTNKNSLSWRLPFNSSKFRGQIKIVFSSGRSYILKNPHKRNAWGDGFIYRPGLGSVASGTGTSHGGIYIVGPSGDRSKNVRIMY